MLFNNLMIFRVLDFFMIFRINQLLLLEKKRKKEVNNLSEIPKSNVSYDTIKKNQTLFGCLGKDCSEIEEENEEETTN